MKTLTHELVESTNSLVAQLLMEHVHNLTVPEMRGRMPGDIGYARACTYCERVFQDLKLVPHGDNGTYRQHFTLETNRIVEAKVSCNLPNGELRPLALGPDYLCRGLSGGGSVTGPVVFVGHARDDDQLPELTGLELSGSIALSFKYPPSWQTGQRGELPREKAHRLKKLGVLGLAMVPNPNGPQRDRLSASLMEELPYLPDFPMIVLSEDLATKLMTHNGATLASRQYQIDTLKQPASGHVPARMSIHLETDWREHGDCWNVIGVLPGSDPRVADQAVMIGAHLDHVGIQGERVIFPGAQDNASGVAAMLTLARTMTLGKRPRRTIIFIAFGAEEAGIKGSRYCADHPPWPIAHIGAMFNLDCMGAGTGLDARGRKHYPELFTILDHWNESVIHVPDTQAEHPAGGADAEPFHQAGIPNMFIVSQKPYEHLHSATDKPETLNPVLFEAITRLVYLTVMTVADR